MAYCPHCNRRYDEANETQPCCGTCGHPISCGCGGGHQHHPSPTSPPPSPPTDAPDESSSDGDDEDASTLADESLPF